MKTEEEKLVSTVQSIIDRACELGREGKDTPKNKVVLDNEIYKLLKMLHQSTREVL